ncbi:MAG: MFS transporter [bacterium]|nr:MFS transporter [bacterium]
MTRPVMFAALIAFLLMLGLGVLFPVLPMFTRELELTDFQAGLLLSSYPLAGVFVSPFWGWVSGRVGRKPAIVVGLFGFGVGFSLFGLGTTFEQLLGARLLGGLFSAAALPAVLAYAADVTPPDRRSTAMGAIGAAIGLGVSFGPLMGGLVGHALGVRAPYFLSGAIGISSAIGVWIWLPESLTDSVREQIDRHRVALKADGLTTRDLVQSMLPLLVFSFLTSTGRIGLDSTLGFLALDRLGWTEREVGIVLFAAGMMVALVQGGLIRPLARVFSDRALMTAGTLVMGTGLVGVGLSMNASTLVASGLTVALGFALLTPTFNAALSRAAEGFQGEAQGFNSTAQALSRVVGPVAFLFLYQAVGSASPYFLAAALCAIAARIAFRTSDSSPPDV